MSEIEITKSASSYLKELLEKQDENTVGIKKQNIVDVRLKFMAEHKIYPTLCKKLVPESSWMQKCPRRQET